MNKDKSFEKFSAKKEGLVILFVLLLSLIHQNIFAEKPCGRLLGAFSDDCIVVRGDERQRIKPKINMLLYPGDVIVQKNNIEKIIINTSPFTKLYQIHPNAIWIEYKPLEKKNQWPKYLRWLNILKEEKHLSEYADTRDITYEDINPSNLYPKPGRRASVLPGESILFSWESRLVKSFVIIDGQGKEVFRRKLNSETSIELNVNEIGMEPFLKYYWGIEVEGIVGIRADYELKLLDSDILRIVEAGFEKIEKETLEPKHEKLKKAAYLQFISDIYGSDAELYWKSGQILAEIDGDKLEEKQYIRLYQLLLIKYRDHHEKG